MPDDTLPAVGQKLVGKLGDETRSFRFQGSSEHLAGTLAGDLGQRVKDGSGLAERGDRGIFGQGVSFLLEVLAGLDTRHDTPPSQAPSPIFSHSSGVYLQARMEPVAECMLVVLGATPEGKKELVGF